MVQGSEESEEGAVAAPKAKLGPVRFLKLVAQSLTFGFAGPKVRPALGAGGGGGGGAGW